VGWIDWSGRVTVGELDRDSGASRVVVIARVYQQDLDRLHRVKLS